MSDFLGRSPMNYRSNKLMESARLYKFVGYRFKLGQPMRQGLESTRDSATSNSNFVPLCVDSRQTYEITPYFRYFTGSAALMALRDSYACSTPFLSG